MSLRTISHMGSECSSSEVVEVVLTIVDMQDILQIGYLAHEHRDGHR